MDDTLKKYNISYIFWNNNEKESEKNNYSNFIE